MDRKECLSLIEIREKLKLLQGAEKREFLVCSNVPGGVPRGVICEITGSARTEWTLQLLKQNSRLNVFWVEDRLTLFPTAIQQRGIDLSRILIAETGDLLFQVLRKGLRSRLFDCVVLPGVIEELRMLKALQLFARDSNATVIFLSKVVKNAWMIPFQLSVEWIEGGVEYRVEVLKSKVSSSGEL